ANDPTLRFSEPPKFVPAVPRDGSPALPNFAATQTKIVAAPKFDVAPAAPAPGANKAPIIRAIRELPGDDPFDVANQRVALNRIAALNDPAKFTALLSKGHEE